MARETRFSLPDIKQTAENAGFVVYDRTGKQRALNSIDQVLGGGLERYNRRDLAKLAGKTRDKNLERFADFFNKIENHESIRQLAYERAKATEMGLKPEDLVPESESNYDKTLGTATDKYGEKIKVISSDPELSRLFWRHADADVRNRSKTELARIDNLFKETSQPDYDIIIVGAGLAASQLVSQIGPYYNVCVVTDKRHVAADTRFRPVYANSSVIEEDINGPRLPTLNNGTTPVSPIGQIHTIRPGQLLSPSALRVTCDDDSIRYYPPFNIIGEAAGVNTLSYADQILVNQICALDSIEKNLVGYPTIKMSDLETGVTRKISGKRIIIATGPGVDKSIQNDFLVEVRKRAFKIANLADTNSLSPAELKSLGTLNLPKSLTLADIATALEFWHCELNCDPDLWPFHQLFKQGNSVVIGGNGDSAFCLREFVTGKAPAFAYPREFDPHVCPDTTLVGTRYKNRNQIDKSARLRYAQSQPKSGKNDVLKGTVIVATTPIDKKTKVEVKTDTDTRFIPADFYLDGTGLKPSSIKSLIPDLQEFIDPNGGSPFALATPDRRIITSGTASSLPIRVLEPELKLLLDRIGTQENSLAAFTAAIQNQILGDYLLADLRINVAKIADTLGLAIRPPKTFIRERDSLFIEKELLSLILKTLPKKNL